MKQCRALLFSFIVIILLGACNKAEEKPLVIIDSIPVKEASWSGPETFFNSLISPLLFSPLLYREEGNKETHNVLAESVTLLPEGGAEVKLRNGITFHNGEPFTAEDIAPSMERLRREMPRIFGERFSGLKVEVLDMTRFRLTGKSPRFKAKDLLEYIYAYPAGSSPPWTGTGPFKVSRWFEGGVELAANEKYFDGSPEIKKIVYLYEENERKRLFKLLKGEADLMMLISPGTARFLKGDSRFYMKAEKGHQYHAITFNFDSPLISDLNVRKALSMGMNREALIKKGLMGAGESAFGPLPTAPPRSSSQGYRPKEALRLLQEAGWSYGGKEGILEKGGKRLKLTLYYAKDIEAYPRIVDIISQQLYEIGVELHAVPVAYGEILKDGLKGEEAMALLLPVAAFDQTNFQSWHSSGERNLGRFSSSRADRLLERLIKTGEGAEKAGIHEQLQEVFDEEVPAAFLYYDLFYTAANRRFKGAEDFVADIYSIYRIKEWGLNDTY